MKKFTAGLVALLMVVAMLATAVSAAEVVVVGGDNGVGDFAPTTPGGTELNIKVTEVTHKYAVDVTFNLSDLTIGGSITWNVNDMKYDVDGTTLADTTQTITVSNRSDLPVYAYATVKDTDADNGISITADKDGTDNRLTVAKATAGTGEANGTATDGTLNIIIKSANWNTVAEYYAAKKLADETQNSFKIATVTVTITKN